MDLLAVGIVLVLLFVATYSQRRTWIALGSAALSVALVAGLLFLATAQDSAPFRDGIARLAKILPAGWDRHAQDLTAAMERASVALADARHRRTPERAPEPILATSVWSISDWFDWTSEPTTEAKAEADPEAKAGWSISDWFDWSSEPAAKTSPETPAAAELDPKPKPKATSVSGAAGSAIEWYLDAPAPAGGGAFTLVGANVSDQPVKAIRATLKPDSGAGRLRLALDVVGRDGEDDGVIPPGTRFSLTAPGLTADEAAQLGGAILSFAYHQEGRRKTSIMYLAPTTLAKRTASDETSAVTAR